MSAFPSRTDTMPRRSDSGGDGDALDHLLGEFREWLQGKKKERMAQYRPTSPEPAAEASADGPEGDDMSDECREGRCDHPEHWKDGDLDSLLD